jgi:hypothetical protein
MALEYGVWLHDLNESGKEGVDEYCHKQDHYEGQCHKRGGSNVIGTGNHSFYLPRMLFSY